MTIVAKHFPSPVAFGKWAQTNMFTPTAIAKASNGIYGSNDEAVRQGINFLLNGDSSLVAQAQEMSKKFTENIPSLRKTWASDVAGFFPNVPAYLAGEPESMWRMDTEETDTTPIRIWVGVNSHHAVTRDALLKRGVALAAFAMALSERRTVLITPYTGFYLASGPGGHEQASFISWDLQASPFVFSQLCSLMNPEIIRNLSIRARLFQATSQNRKYEVSERIARRILGCDEQDIWLGPADIYDVLSYRPEDWIKKQLVKYAGIEESEPAWQPPATPRDETYTCPVCGVKFQTWKAYYDHLPKNPKCNKWMEDYYKQQEKDAKEREKLAVEER